MSWMVVALFSRTAKAEPIAKRLTEAGFTTRIQGESWLHALWFVRKRSAGARVEVPSDQFERAQQCLLNFDATTGALAEAVRCPECHGLRVRYPQSAEHSMLTNLTLGTAAMLGVVEKHYYCEKCHYTWPRDGTQARRDRPHMAPYYFVEGIEQTTRDARSEADGERKAA
jgi:hypothetical protein